VLFVKVGAIKRQESAKNSMKSAFPQQASILGLLNLNNNKSLIYW
jgi:hypothetical protein